MRLYYNNIGPIDYEVYLLFSFVIYRPRANFYLFQHCQKAENKTLGYYLRHVFILVLNINEAEDVFSM